MKTGYHPAQETIKSYSDVICISVDQHTVVDWTYVLQYQAVHVKKIIDS